jgi:hypothetical protein
MNKQALLQEAIFEQERQEFDGEVVSDLSEVSKGYAGMVLHINDHGNVTLYRAFKNGSFHEVASCV